MAIDDGDHQVAPYAGGETGNGGKSGSSNPGGKAIPARDLHSSDGSNRPGPAIRDDIDPIGYIGGTEARYPGIPGYERNTARGVQGATIPTGEFTDDSSLQVPGSLAPYAGADNTEADASCAAGQGL